MSLDNLEVLCLPLRSHVPLGLLRKSMPTATLLCRVDALLPISYGSVIYASPNVIIQCSYTHHHLNFVYYVTTVYYLASLLGNGSKGPAGLPKPPSGKQPGGKTGSWHIPCFSLSLGYAIFGVSYPGGCGHVEGAWKLRATAARMLGPRKRFPFP